jgi:hypothetical protein
MLGGSRLLIFADFSGVWLPWSMLRIPALGIPPWLFWFCRSSERPKLHRSRISFRGTKSSILPLSGKSERSRHQALRRAGTQLHPRHSRPAPRTRQDQCPALATAGDWHRRRSADGWKVLLLHPARGQSEPAHPLCARGLNGDDRVLVDVNKLAADGTVALDWWYASEDGKYVAYGTSPSGSEISTLRVIETASGKLLPDAIERTRAASLAWKHDNSGFFYTRYPKKGDVPEGQEVYTGTCSITRLAPIRRGPADFRRRPRPGVVAECQPFRRWTLVADRRGARLDEDELFLQDLTSKNPPGRNHRGQRFPVPPIFFEGKLYITTNEDAPHYRVFVADATNPKRENWKELIPQTDAVLQGASVTGGKLLAQYEHNATSELKLFGLDGKKARRHSAAGHWTFSSAPAAMTATKSFSDSSLSPCHLRFTASI